MQDKTAPDGNELTVNLVRLRKSDHGTEGILFFRHFSCFTMELPWRDNRRNISCIPPDIYNVQIRVSPYFGRLHWISDITEKETTNNKNPNHKQIPPTGVSGETMTKISNSKPGLSDNIMFWTLKIGILNLYGIWHLVLGIYAADRGGLQIAERPSF